MPKKANTGRTGKAKGKAPARRANNTRDNAIPPPATNPNVLLIQVGIAVTLVTLITNSTAVSNLKTLFKRSSMITDLVGQLMGVTSNLPDKWNEGGPHVVPLFFRGLEDGLTADQADTSLRGACGERAHFIFTARVGTVPTVAGAIPAQLVLAEYQPDCASVGGTKAGLIAFGVQETYLCEIVPNLASKGKRANVFARSEIKVFSVAPSAQQLERAPRVRKLSRKVRDQLEVQGSANDTANAADEDDSDGDESLSEEGDVDGDVLQISRGALASAGGESTLESIEMLRALPTANR